MSDAGEIDERDLATMVQKMREEHEGEPLRLAMVNALYPLWDTYGGEETDPDLSKDEAQDILDELPLEIAE